MTDATNQSQPPESVRVAAATVQKWLDEHQQPGTAASVPELSATERFNLHRRQQFEKSRTEEPNLRKAR